MPRGNPENMRPMNTLSVEEQKKICSAGGKASGKARRDKRKLRDCLEVLLEAKVTDDETGKKVTGAEAMTKALFQRALAGDDKAWELFRDTVGQKPIDRVEQTNTNIVIDLSDFDDDTD